MAWNVAEVYLPSIPGSLSQQEGTEGRGKERERNSHLLSLLGVPGTMPMFLSSNPDGA